MANYTNQTNIEAFLNRSLTASEIVLLGMILNSVDFYINSELDTSFGTSTATDRYYDGGSSILNIDPCTDVTEVSIVDNAELNPNTYVLNEDFEARPRNGTIKTWLAFRNCRTPCGVANIKVTAKFGSGELPSDIIFLATYLAGKLYSTNESGNLKSESIEGYSRTFSEFKNNDEIIQLTLRKYSSNNIFT